MRPPLKILAGPVLIFLSLAAGTHAAATPSEGSKKLNAAEAAIAGEAYEADAASPDVTSPAITTPYGKAWAGAPDGDVTLVIFTDYGCAPCCAAQAVTDRLIAEDPKLRVVYRFVALDGYPGRTAAYASFDAAAEEVYDKQGFDGAQPNISDWHAFHRALMARQAVTLEAIGSVARTINMPLSILSLDYSPTDAMQGHHNAMSYDAELAGNEVELNDREGTSVPAWVVGEGDVTEGYDYAAIKAAIAKARAAAPR